MNDRRYLFYLALATLVLSGCTSEITGNEGNLTFTYTTDDQAANFNKPIAVGAKLELRVFEVATNREVEIQSAQFDPEQVLTVESTAHHRLIAAGVGEGSALLEVTARMPDGEVVSDSVDMQAAVATSLRMRHFCDEKDTVYVIDGSQDILVPFELEAEDGQPVIGYGYFPIEIEPASHLTLLRTKTDQANFHFDVASAGEITVRSTIDDTTLTFHSVKEEAIEDAEIDTSGLDREIEVASTAFVRVWPMIEGERVCQPQIPTQAESMTPEICEVRASETGGETGWVSVEGKAAGDCQINAGFPGANAGAGAFAQGTLSIVETM